MGSEPAPIEPDTKDWTWVIDQGCPECGYTPPEPTEVADRVRATIARWTSALQRPNAARRSDSAVWSVLEYGCHVRDVCVIFGARVQQMLTESDPTFANWNQDEAAAHDRYHAQQPASVAGEYAEAAGHAASLFEGVQGDQWFRPGTRSNGSLFTVATLGVYFVHDLEHHLHDVAG
ncbi:DinB family protein [Micropruina sp.]|uniref:DinB family protein n=1 Tax=Micropruina sp. TaxID=2737536 RepID=UPI0039E245BF